MNRSERESLLDGLTEIDRYVDELDLDSSVQQRATELYRKALSTEDLITGRGVNQIVAGSILLAARESNDVREADEVAEQAPDHIQAKTIHRCTLAMRKELDLGFMLADPHKYVDQIQEKLDASDEMTDTTHDIVDFVMNDGVGSGKKAAAVAACSFYLLGVFDKANGSHGKYTQSEVANAAGVTEVTIRNSYRDFAKALANGDSDDIAIDITPAQV